LPGNCEPPSVRRETLRPGTAALRKLKTRPVGSYFPQLHNPRNSRKSFLISTPHPGAMEEICAPHLIRPTAMLTHSHPCSFGLRPLLTANSFHHFPSGSSLPIRCGEGIILDPVRKCIYFVFVRRFVMGDTMLCYSIRDSSRRLLRHKGSVPGVETNPFPPSSNFGVAGA